MLCLIRDGGAKANGMGAHDEPPHQEVRVLDSGALGLVGTLPGCGEDTDELRAFDSLEATYHAVDEIVDCSDDAPEPAGKPTASGGPTGESVMCTSTVEVLWFDSDEARQELYDLLADTAGGGGSVSFAEGRHWFASGGAEVMVGAVPERSIDTEQLADALGARYTGERQGPPPASLGRVLRAARSHRREPRTTNEVRHLLWPPSPTGSSATESSPVWPGSRTAWSSVSAARPWVPP